MKHLQNQMMFDIGKLRNLVENSYEDIMTKVHNAVMESGKIFGKEATLLATYPNRIVVINESGQVSSVDYSIKDGLVKFGKKTTLEIPSITQDDITRKAIDAFFDGESLSEGMKGLVVTSLFRKADPLDELKTKLDALFSSGVLWRGLVKDNSANMAKFAFDPKYGSPKIESKVKFESLYSGLTEDEEMENHRGEVVASLLSMAKRLNKLFVAAKESFKAYKDAGGKAESEVLGHFEAFSEDYIDDIGRVSNFVSESIRNSESDCVACLAFVHDEVARRATEFELGERLIRKVSNEFAR